MFPTIFYSLIAGIATITGTVLVFCYENFTKRNSVYFISFAAGIMLSTSFFHLIPEASTFFAGTSVWVLIGFLLFYIIQNFLVVMHPCPEEHCEVHQLGIMSFIGLAAHSLLDGVAIVVGFEVSPRIGLFTSLAVILHEFPEGLITTAILLHSKMPRKKIWVYSTVVALATPFGAIIPLLFIKNFPQNVLGATLSLTAGSFIYLAATDLIPEIHKSRNKINSIILVAGILFVWVIGKVCH